jgi:hypothetical protein
MLGWRETGAWPGGAPDTTAPGNGPVGGGGGGGGG